jgi:hypothetical protein
MKKYVVGSIEKTSDGNVMVMRVSEIQTEFMKLFDTYSSFTVTNTNWREKGTLGNGPHRPTDRNQPTQAYRAWQALLCRRTINFGVCDEWLNYQVFAEWYYSQLNRHGDRKKLPFKWSLTHLLIDPDNQDHDPVTCCIAPSPVVRMFNNPLRAKRSLPAGVHFYGDRFTAYCSMFQQGQKHLGVFDSVESARSAYWSAKCESIQHTARAYQRWLPRFLADRLMSFDLETAKIYYPDEFSA